MSVFFNPVGNFVGGVLLYGTRTKHTGTQCIGGQNILEQISVTSKHMHHEMLWQLNEPVPKSIGYRTTKCSQNVSSGKHFGTIGT